MNLNLNEENGYKKGLSTRGKAIDFTTVLDVIEVIKEKAPYYYEMIKDGKLPDYQKMYRGAGHISRSSSNFKQVKIYNPKKFKRHSANTENYYTEIMDNSKYWSEYPKRSTSIVGSTSKEKAKKYGTVYHIIPIEENSKIGIAPASDIWHSFNYTLENLNKLFKEDIAVPTATPDFKHLAGLNNFLRTKFNLSKDADYKEMKKKVFLDDKSFSLLDRESTWNNSRYDYDKEKVLAIQDKWGTFLNYIEYLLSPKWNNFELERYNRSVTLPRDREVWTDSECLLIEETLHDRVLLALE